MEPFPCGLGSHACVVETVVPELDRLGRRLGRIGDKVSNYSAGLERYHLSARSTGKYFHKVNYLNEQSQDMEENHQKKLLYFTVIDIEEKSFAGVAKKVLGQVEAFQNLGYDTYLLCFASSKLALFHGEEKTVYKHLSLCWFHRTLQLYRHLSDLCHENYFDILYIRFPLCNWWFYRALSRSRKNIGKMILELPTYPYDVECEQNHNMVTQFCWWQDKHLRNKLKRFVDLIVTYGDVKDKQNLRPRRLCKQNL